MIAVYVLALGAVLFPSVQPETVGSQDISGLLEKLGSESIEDREEATRRLVGMGNVVVPQLEKALSNGTLDTSGRIRTILLRIKVRSQVTPHLLQALPDLEGRLAVQDRHVWTIAFLELAAGIVRRNAASRDLTSGDLESLAPQALQSAADSKERIEVCRLIGACGLASMSRDLIPLLVDVDPAVRRVAVSTLGTCGAQEGHESIVKLLDDESELVRAAAVTTVGDLSILKACPRLVDKLSDVSVVRRCAIVSLCKLHFKDAQASIEKCLADKDQEIRITTAAWLCELESRKGIPLLLSEARNLVFLNSLRDHSAWLRLCQGSKEPISDSPKTILLRLADQAGLKVEWSAELTADQVEWLSAKLLPNSTERLSRIDMLDLLAEGPAEFIVESDRLRILSRDEALASWKRWASGSEK
jgi:HEAT repeat protein